MLASALLLGALVFSSDFCVERPLTMFSTGVPRTGSRFTLGATRRAAETGSIAMRTPTFRADHFLTRQAENVSYGEDDSEHESGGLNLARLSLDASEARFLNRGTTSFDIDRLRVRLGFDLPAGTNTTLIAEYGEDKFSQRSADYANFNARRFGFFVRYRPSF